MNESWWSSCVPRESPAVAGLAALHRGVGTVPGYLGFKLHKTGHVPSDSSSGFCWTAAWPWWWAAAAPLLWIVPLLSFSTASALSCLGEVTYSCFGRKEWVLPVTECAPVSAGWILLYLSSHKAPAGFLWGYLRNQLLTLLTISK